MFVFRISSRISKFFINETNLLLIAYRILQQLRVQDQIVHDQFQLMFLVQLQQALHEDHLIKIKMHYIHSSD